MLKIKVNFKDLLKLCGKNKTSMCFEDWRTTIIFFIDYLCDL